jgi:hypothetical protein
MSRSSQGHLAATEFELQAKENPARIAPRGAALIGRAA